MKGLQDTLQELSLQLEAEGRNCGADRVLLGKLLTSRVIRKFAVAEIISKTWGMKAKVQIEKLEDNTFKFMFITLQENDRIFRGQPWSFNGIHMVLKKWPGNVAIQQVSFQTTTFVMQIHGLPPIFMHSGTAEKIGNAVGVVHAEFLSRKCVVAQRFLRIKLDIPIVFPLPAGFFQKQNDMTESWIQFKFEQLGDFCYKCEMIDHVIKRCSYKEPSTVSSTEGIIAQTYGPWMRAEHAENLRFITRPQEEEVKRSFAKSRKVFELENQLENCETLCQELEKALTNPVANNKGQKIAMVQCQELGADNRELEKAVEQC